jgi:hypothetical protein
MTLPVAKNRNQYHWNVIQMILDIRTLPRHCRSTNDGYSGVRNAANNNGPYCSFWDS